MPIARGGALSRRTLMRTAGAAALAAVAAPHVARAQASQKVTISFPTRSGATWPIWLAKEGGLYEKHGLDVTPVFGVHPAGIAALVSGEAQMTNYGVEQILAASARDPAFVMMGSSLNKGSFALMVKPEINTIAELKGKRINVGRLGDPPYFYTVDLLAKHGLTPKDVQWVPSGADASARAAVLLAGQVDAALLTMPSYFRLEAKGLKVLDKVSRYDDIPISTAYTFKKSWVAANPDVPRRIVMAHAEAIKRFYEDKDFAVAAYRKHDPQTEPDVSRIWDEYTRDNVLDRVPLLSMAAVTGSAARLTEEIPALKTFDFQSVIDMGPVRKLIAEGYFVSLFGDGVRAEQERKLKASYA